MKVALVVVGLLFVAAIYPLVFLLHQEPTLQMMLSIYVTLGVFLLVASRNPPRTAVSSPLLRGRAWHTPALWRYSRSAM